MKFKVKEKLLFIHDGRAEGGNPDVKGVKVYGRREREGGKQDTQDGCSWDKWEQLNGCQHYQSKLLLRGLLFFSSKVAEF